MAEQGNDCCQVTDTHSPAELVQAVLANHSTTPPGAVADEVYAAFYLGYGRPGQLKAQLDAQEFNDPLSTVEALRSRHADQHKIIHIPNIMFYPKHAFDEMVKRIKVNQRIDLAEQVADGDAARAIMLGKQHHYIDQASVLDFSLDQAPQDSPVD